jgi:hypothetical protein
MYLQVRLPVRTEKRLGLLPNVHIFTFISRSYIILFLSFPSKKVVGLERGPLSLVSTTEELLDRKVAASV